MSPPPRMKRKRSPSEHNAPPSVEAPARAFKGTEPPMSAETQQALNAMLLADVAALEAREAQEAQERTNAWFGGMGAGAVGSADVDAAALWLGAGAAGGAPGEAGVEDMLWERAACVLLEAVDKQDADSQGQGSQGQGSQGQGSKGQGSKGQGSRELAALGPDAGKSPEPPESPAERCARLLAGAPPCATAPREWCEDGTRAGSPEIPSRRFVGAFKQVERK